MANKAELETDLQAEVGTEKDKKVTKRYCQEETHLGFATAWGGESDGAYQRQTMAGTKTARDSYEEENQHPKDGVQNQTKERQTHSNNRELTESEKTDS